MIDGSNGSLSRAEATTGLVDVRAQARSLIDDQRCPCSHHSMIRA
jgi:hypothetical protein